MTNEDVDALWRLPQGMYIDPQERVVSSGVVLVIKSTLLNSDGSMMGVHSVVEEEEEDGSVSDAPSVSD